LLIIDGLVIFSDILHFAKYGLYVFFVACLFRRILLA